jgi:cold shock protein
MEGKVKFFRKEKNYGFIAGNDGKDYFVSSDDFEGDSLNEGQEVNFEVGQGDKGPKAVKVSKK